MCCWRFVRLEAGGCGYEAEEDHTPRLCRVGIYMRARGPSVLLAPSRNPRPSSSSRSSGSTAHLARLLVVPPDFFFHVSPTMLHLTSSFSARATHRSVPLSFLSPAIVPPDFFYRETDRGVIYRACSWLPEPPVILHSGTDMPARGERCAEDE